MNNVYLASSLLETAVIINNFSKNLLVFKYPTQLVDPINDEDSYHIMLNGEKVNCGSIVCRPLSMPGLNLVFHHFAIVLGTNDESEEILLECTANFHVRMINKKGFLDRYAEEEVKVYSDLKIPVQTILDRANRYYHTRYSLLDFNCYDFALYCANEKEPDERSRYLHEAYRRLEPIKSIIVQEYIKSIDEIR